MEADRAWSELLEVACLSPCEIYNLRDLLYLVTTVLGLIQMIGRNHVRIKYTTLYPLVLNDDIMYKKDE